jgi:hypothetical protein
MKILRPDDHHSLESRILNLVVTKKPIETGILNLEITKRLETGIVNIADIDEARRNQK